MASQDDRTPTSAAQLRAARAMLGLSQDQIAKLSGTSRRTIVSVENGDTSVSGESVSAICQALELQGIVFDGGGDYIGVRMMTGTR